MHRYNIISKSGKGNKYGSIYTFVYQVDGKSDKYRCELYCRGSENRVGKFCYLAQYKYPLKKGQRLLS